MVADLVPSQCRTPGRNQKFFRVQLLSEHVSLCCQTHLTLPPGAEWFLIMSGSQPLTSMDLSSQTFSGLQLDAPSSTQLGVPLPPVPEYFCVGGVGHGFPGGVVTIYCLGLVVPVCV